MHSPEDLVLHLTKELEGQKKIVAMLLDFNERLSKAEDSMTGELVTAEIFKEKLQTFLESHGLKMEEFENYCAEQLDGIHRTPD